MPIPYPRCRNKCSLRAAQRPRGSRRSAVERGPAGAATRTRDPSASRPGSLPRALGCLALVSLLALVGCRATRGGTTAAPQASPKSGAVSISPRDAAEMVYVPAGECTIGSPDDELQAWGDEYPQHRRYLNAFWIDKNLVTVARYRKFCQATRRPMPPAPEWGWQDDHPIVNVTWQEAADYAAWAGKRLPAEAEWEKAARGADGRRYPWGEEWEAGKCANSVGENHLRGTRPVGSCPAGVSPYGALDMAGNVWEWCADWYDPRYHPDGSGRSPTPYRVVRGGSWEDDDPALFRSAFRNHFDVPGDRDHTYGFRCVRGAP
jgi:formylglycine-generating enzyme required for sulfatase activity